MGKTVNLEEPRLSVGLPVYNGEKFLREAIESILRQTFKDFELIISDNASTDGAQEICKAYATKDPRVRYYRNPVNIGGGNNANQTFRLARGVYFRWAAHDDVCAPELFERCIAVLDKDPSMVLCHSKVVHIDAQGNKIREVSNSQGSEERPHERFRSLSDNWHRCEHGYGVIRSDILRETRLQLNYTGSDRTLLCELGLRGRFHEIPELLFFKRLHSENQYNDLSGRMAWFDPSLKDKPVFPKVIQFFDYLVTINRVPISCYEKLRCYCVMLYWPFLNSRYLAKEFIAAGITSARWVNTRLGTHRALGIKSETRESWTIR
jgi:glycosyltransferase involved in cell wall biosynthesis